MEVTIISIVLLYFFFFQAEDGIRDWSVTGVQTCALPIYCEAWFDALGSEPHRAAFGVGDSGAAGGDEVVEPCFAVGGNEKGERRNGGGRRSEERPCRERG